MFKPSLKRSKINQGSLRTQATSRGSQLTSSNDKATFIFPLYFPKVAGSRTTKKRTRLFVLSPLGIYNILFKSKKNLTYPLKKSKVDWLVKNLEYFGW